MDQPLGTSSGTFDPRLAALFFPCMSALIGLGFAAFGLWLIVSPGSVQSQSSSQRFGRDLTAWGATAGNAVSSEMKTLHRRFIQLGGWPVLVAGLCGALVSVAMAWLAIGAPEPLASITGSGDLPGAFLYQGITLGWTLGYLVGSYTVTRVAVGPTWADLRRRRVSDYRVSWLGWGPFAVVGATLALLAAMYLIFPHVRVVGPSESQPWLTLPTVPLLPALAVWTLLIPCLGALFCRWIATSPRTMTASNPQVARATDEWWRALSIGLVTSYTWMSCGVTLTAVANLASQNLTTPLSMPGFALDALSFLGLLASILGMGLNLLRGQLGGRLAYTRPSLEYILAGMSLS